MMGMIGKYRKPRTAGHLARALGLWLEDSLGMVGNAGRHAWGGDYEVEARGFAARVIVEDADRADGRKWVELDEAQREHLEAWDAAGRPTLEEIHRANGLGRLTQVEAAAVRSIRAGEAFEAIGFTPEEVATMRRNAFLDVLARGVDAGLGEPEPPPVEPKPAPKPRRKAKAR